ncbi:hypothetical protein X733_04380 [Mesorhizobium sp. L2C067A000]|nr:hypothetical protein X733_04380 [Mesorhizobium sp. L2C067A000]
MFISMNLKAAPIANMAASVRRAMRMAAVCHGD